jgi:hypothetical protein
LTNGTTYWFVVTAEDSAAPSNENDPQSMTQFTATPVFSDTTPPSFGGLTGAADAQSYGQVILTWDAATDPSTPITYNIYWNAGAVITDFS